MEVRVMEVMPTEGSALNTERGLRLPFHYGKFTCVSFPNVLKYFYQTSGILVRSHHIFPIEKLHMEEVCL
jgi:hypothetical protein